MKSIKKVCSAAFFVALTMATFSANAENSVILDYDYVSAGYFYRDYDTALGNVDGHGAGIEISKMLAGDFGLSLTSMAGSVSDLDADMWGISPSLFYVVKISDTMNLVPNVAWNVEHVDYSSLGMDNTTSEVQFGLRLDTAVTESFQVSVGTEYRNVVGSDLPLDDDDRWDFYLGANVALTDQLGLGAQILTTTENVDFGAQIGFEWHF